MNEKFPVEARDIMDERFGRDTLIALATVDGEMPSVRTVNAYYEDGSFYVITYALSNKIKQLVKNPRFAICGDWFTAHGTGENLGYIFAPENEMIAAKLKDAFAEWFDNGHNDYSDRNTVILRLRLYSGVLFSHGTRYDIDFGG